MSNIGRISDTLLHGNFHTKKNKQVGKLNQASNQEPWAMRNASMQAAKQASNANKRRKQPVQVLSFLKMGV